MISNYLRIYIIFIHGFKVFDLFTNIFNLNWVKFFCIKILNPNDLIHMILAFKPKKFYQHKKKVILSF